MADGDGTYGGIIGAFPFAYRSSASRLFRTYAVLGGLLTVLILFLFVIAIVVALGNTASVVGGTFTFSRAFIIMVGTTTAAPVVAPVLLVARRHRRTSSTRTYDRAMAAAGYLYILALYLCLAITAPAAYQDDPGGLVAPVAEFLYDLPALAGSVPILFAIGVGYLLHRQYR